MRSHRRRREIVRDRVEQKKEIGQNRIEKRAKSLKDILCNVATFYARRDLVFLEIQSFPPQSRTAASVVSSLVFYSSSLPWSKSARPRSASRSKKFAKTFACVRTPNSVPGHGISKTRKRKRR